MLIAVKNITAIIAVLFSVSMIVSAGGFAAFMTVFLYKAKKSGRKFYMEDKRMAAAIFISCTALAGCGAFILRAVF